MSEDLKEVLTGPRIQRADIPKEDYLSSGSTLFNLASSGMPDCGLAKGRYFWMAGDSSTGKTFLTLTCFAEACRNPNWSGYDLIFDDVEGGALMDFDYYFGHKMAERVEPPSVDEDGDPVYSEISEDFYFTLDDRLTAVEDGKAPPFIYLLDSMDALSSNYERKKFDEHKDARRAGKQAKGDYGDGKAKINSRWMRNVVARLRDTKSTLIIVSQTRDNIDAGLFESSKTVSGGRALKFYAAWQLWSSLAGHITKVVNGTKRQLGIRVKLSIKKNRLTGKEWTVEIPIYHSFGIDDVGSCVDFLVSEKHWTIGKTGGIIEAPEFQFKGRRETLIKKIEDEGLVFDLRDLVTEAWREIEKACRVDRHRRYD